MQIREGINCVLFIYEILYNGENDWDACYSIDKFGSIILSEKKILRDCILTLFYNIYK